MLVPNSFSRSPTRLLRGAEMVLAQDDAVPRRFELDDVLVELRLLVGRKRIEPVHHRADLGRLAGDGKHHALARQLGRIDRADEELPGHRVQRSYVAGVSGGAAAERFGIGVRHAAGNRPTLGHHRLKVLRLLRHHQVQQPQHRPHHRDDEHQDDRHQGRQHGAKPVATDVTEDKFEVFHESAGMIPGHPERSEGSAANDLPRRHDSAMETADEHG